MKNFLGLHIASRYLFSKKTHNAVNIITGVALCATAIATAAIVIVLSVFNGFRELAESKYSRFDPPFKIVSDNHSYFNVDSIKEIIEGLSNDCDVIPVVSGKAFVMSDGYQSVCELYGVDNRYMDRQFSDGGIIDGIAYVGDTLQLQWSVIGSALAYQLNCRPGMASPLSLMVPRRTGRLNPGSLLSSFRNDTLYVAGVFQSGEPQIDQTALFVSIPVARGLLSLDDNEMSSLYVYPKKDFDVATLEREVSSKGFRMMNIEEQNMEAFRMINVEKWVSFTLLAFIFIIASFNIVSALTILIIEKRSNMGVLRALGCSRKSIRSIFVWEGVLMSLWGAGFGCVAGFVLVMLQHFFGFIKLSGGNDNVFLVVESYPVALNIADFLVVLGLVIVLSFLTTLLCVSSVTRDDEKLKAR